MFEKLKLNIIYDDFIKKTNLSNEQIEILNMLIQKETYVYISYKMNMSERKIGKEIHKLKRLYYDYRDVEMARLEILKRQ